MQTEMVRFNRKKGTLPVKGQGLSAQRRVKKIEKIYGEEKKRLGPSKAWFNSPLIQSIQEVDFPQNPDNWKNDGLPKVVGAQRWFSG